MCDELALKRWLFSEAMRLGLLGFSLDHHDEEDSAFVPTAEPAHAPIIDTIAK